jgi:hypothetical protein
MRRGVGFPQLWKNVMIESLTLKKSKKKRKERLGVERQGRLLLSWGAR